jgi:hypothetical protein
MPSRCVLPENHNLAPKAVFFQEPGINPWDLHTRFLLDYNIGLGNIWPGFGSCHAPGALLLDFRVNITPSCWTKPSYGTFTRPAHKLESSIAPRRLSYNPSNRN